MWRAKSKDAKSIYLLYPYRRRGAARHRPPRPRTMESSTPRGIDRHHVCNARHVFGEAASPSSSSCSSCALGASRAAGASTMMRNDARLLFRGAQAFFFSWLGLFHTCATRAREFVRRGVGWGGSYLYCAWCAYVLLLGGEVETSTQILNRHDAAALDCHSALLPRSSIIRPPHGTIGPFLHK